MKRRIYLIVPVMLMILIIFSNGSFAFSVTYNGNGNSGGTAPIDGGSYSSGATVTVRDNTGALAKTGFTFGGWNTLANGTGTNYAAGSTFKISADTNLYAKWPNMLDYCMTPPFLQAGILPNVLLMLDNSASMFDLAYPDKGCSTCATPRKPNYCYDNTYSDTNSYTGYFTSSYYYDYNIATGVFSKNDSFPNSCSYYISNKFCVDVDASTPKKVTKFAARGDYLNWLTSSKFDVQKKILTGGKWDGTNLISESRGCVGRGFVKQPLLATSNGGNYVEGGTNTAMTLALSIKGFNDSYDDTAPSQGGQTLIYFYTGATAYDAVKCDQAISALSDGTSINQNDRDLVLGCIGATNVNTDLAGKKKQIFQQSLQECWQYFKNDPDSIQGNDYLTVKNFCTDVYNLRDPSKTSLPNNPAAAIKTGDADLLCSDNYVGACYSGHIPVAALPSALTNIFALISPKDAFAGTLGTVQFLSATYSVNENDGTGKITLTVSRSGGEDGAVSIDYATANGTAIAGTDYYVNNGTLSWGNNTQGNKTIDISIIDDGVVEPSETFTVTLSNPKKNNSAEPALLGGTLIATVTINDNDNAASPGTIAFETLAPGAVNESSPGNVTLKVKRLGGSFGAATVGYAVIAGTALEGSDYDNSINPYTGTLTWGDGDLLDKQITIKIVSSAAVEPNETFKVTLSNSTGAALNATDRDASGNLLTTSTATVTITELAVSLGAWPNSWTSDACVKSQHESYCGGLGIPPVTDPTNVVLDTTANYANLPAVIADVAIEGQMSAPLRLSSGGSDYGICSNGTVVCTSDAGCGGSGKCNFSSAIVRFTSLEPSGLVQAFKDKIRIGVMSFNYNGSASECAAGSTIPCPMICSNSPDMNFPKTCLSYLDCCKTAGACTCDASAAATTNKDGTKILHYIGRGVCSNDTATECTADTGCTSPGYCNYVGSHTTGLINVMDNIKASNWTPFSEGFYNAIGYFARNADGTSRTDLRLNSTDFVGTKNPSTASCQQNNVLIISDGVATADQNTSVITLADTATSGTYSPNAGGSSGTCPNYMGSKNLDKLAWLANKRKISNFSETPVNARDHVSTYTVYNGADVYDAADECNSATMMKNTATKGGGNFYQAVNANTMQDQLQAVFDDISAKVSSGTAAAVANNKSGERGANIIQALFYPKWPNDLEKKWLGDIQALWFYVDPIVKFSGIYEDTGQDNILNLASDRAPGNDSLTVKALWKAGEKLHARDASGRKIYTLLNTTQVLTNAANELSTVAANRTLLKPLMDINDAQADEVINYVRGDDGTLRSRKVTNNGVTNKEWKLGDVINSTPQIQGSDELNKFDIDYGDSSYKQFTNSTSYKSNNYVYAGSNDGMLHAFKMGLVATVKDPSNPYKIAQIVDTTDIGKEIWAYVPQNALPYLKYCSDPAYCHQFLVDGAPLLFDASINKHTDCSATNYWECSRQTTLSANSLVEATTSWRTILLGSMGLGGATRDLGASCNRTSVAGPDNKCINTPIAGKGYSSYFALDVTTPTTPTLLWEFSDASIDADATLSGTETDTSSGRIGRTDTSLNKPATKGLGLTTPGGIQIRINSRKVAAPAKSDKTSNGRWFAVFPSGPTGPIDTGTHQFLGQSDQNLKIYIVDLNPSNGAVPDSSNGSPAFKKCTSAAATNCNYWVIDTGIKYAFANSLFNSAIDIDKGDGGSESYYSDDVVYITYTKGRLPSASDSFATQVLYTDSDGNMYPIDWTKGGVLRLITNNDPDPYNWFTSKLIDDIGPVTRSVDLLQDKNNKKLWVFFGEARYFFRQDDLPTTRRIYGVADPCYNYDLDSINKLSTTAGNCPAVTDANLNDQSSSPDAALTATEKGWYINLEAANANYGAERLSGGISTRTNGLVLFTTFIPSLDPCDAGGLPSQWAVNYKTGGAPPAGSLEGKVIMTTSDSPIAKTISLAGAFTQRDGRKLRADLSSSLKGMPPPSPPPSLIFPGPAKKILHIQER